MQRLPVARIDIKLIPQPSAGFVRVDDSLTGEVRELALETFQLLVLFDGESTLERLRLAMTTHRAPASAADAERVVRELDAMLLLQTPRYRARLAEVRRSYNRLPLRKPAFAGATYPRQREALRALLEDVLLASAPGAAPQQQRDLRAVVAPHVDLQPGRRAYAAAYGALRRAAPRTERLIVIGTGHALQRSLLSFSSKDYASPLGLLTADRSAIQKLRDAAGELAEPDDYAHRDEHALEYQALFLRHVLPAGEDPRFIPILTGPLDHWISRVDRLAAVPGADSLIAALAELVTADTLLVAGVDLSHVGHRYGDEQTARELEPALCEHEARLLDALCRGSAEALWSEARRTGDRFRVCGLSSLCLLLEVIELVGETRQRGRVLHHELLHDDANSSAVSIAAASIDW